MMINKFTYHTHFGVLNVMIIHMYVCQVSLILILKLYGIVQCIDMKLSYNVYFIYNVHVHVLYINY